MTGNPLLLAHQQQVVHAPAVVSGGASVHIPAAGTARTTITCRVLLLDGSDVNVDLPVSALKCADSGSVCLHWPAECVNSECLAQDEVVAQVSVCQSAARGHNGDLRGVPCGQQGWP